MSKMETVSEPQKKLHKIRSKPTYLEMGDLLIFLICGIVLKW